MVDPILTLIIIGCRNITIIGMGLEAIGLILMGMAIMAMGTNNLLMLEIRSHILVFKVRLNPSLCL